MLDLLPGFAQGLTKVCISFPFDVVKVKLQKNKNFNTRTCLSYYLKNDPKIFLRGLSIPLITVSAERALSFKLYEHLNNKYNPYISGLITSVIFSPLNVPMQYLTNNIIHDEKKEYKSFIKKELYSTRIFKGYSSELSKNMIGSTLYLGTYGNIRTKLPDNNIGFATSGIIASLSSWVVIFPIDTVRTEIQTTQNMSYKSIILNRIKTQGYCSFWRGIIPVFIRSIPSSGFGMLVYENVKKLI